MTSPILGFTADEYSRYVELMTAPEIDCEAVVEFYRQHYERVNARLRGLARARRFGWLGLALYDAQRWAVRRWARRRAYSARH